MTNSFTVGVIGAGRIGKIHIENLLRKIPDINLKIIVDMVWTQVLYNKLIFL